MAGVIPLMDETGIAKQQFALIFSSKRSGRRRSVISGSYTAAMESPGFASEIGAGGPRRAQAGRRRHGGIRG